MERNDSNRPKSFKPWNVPFQFPTEDSSDESPVETYASIRTKLNVEHFDPKSEHVPIPQKPRKSKNDKDWMDNSTLALIKRKKELQKEWWRTRDPQIHEEYKKIRNAAGKACRTRIEQTRADSDKING